jgi:hypothetical protein
MRQPLPISFSGILALDLALALLFLLFKESVPSFSVFIVFQRSCDPFFPLF